MPRCELSGKGPVVKNLVSHSNIKTKSTAFSNVQTKQLFSNTLNKAFSLRIATSIVRTIDHIGGFDKYILNAPDKQLSKRAFTIKKRIHKKLQAQTKKSAE